MRRFVLASSPFFCLSLLSFVCAAAASCGGAQEPAGGASSPASAANGSPPVPAPTAAPPTAPTIGVDERAMDPSVNPCDDFYEYACGGWMKATPIPEDQAKWMRSFDVIFERNETMLRQILEKDGTSPSDSDAYAKKLGDFYAACMDEKGIEANGEKALKAELAKIAAVKDPATLGAFVATMHAEGVGPLFNFSSAQDFKDATQEIAVAEQGGLGLPDRDYYLKDDPKSKELRQKYEAHVAAMLQLAGDALPVAASGAKTVMKIETALAKASMTKVDLRDPKKVYHRIDLAGLKQLAPTFPWDAYLKTLGFPDIKAINVAQPDFFKALDGSLKATSAADWRIYLRWHLLHATAHTLPQKFVDEDFKLKTALTGAPKILPRWKRCVRATDAAIGEALAQPFVKDTLGAEGKTAAQAMIAQIEAAMSADLTQLGWMDDPTRKKALEKLAKIANKVGYPDLWRKYDSLPVTRDSYFDNALHADAFEMKRQLAKVGKPVDRNEWEMTPPTVNAYYDPSMNEMVFPAGILQPPFYANNMVQAMNYGGIGMVMGHELTHGFDDEGRQFDGDGNLKDWWTPSVGSEFDKRTSCVAQQFDEYVAVEDQHINGKLTLGENIADLGGLKLAYAAFAASKQGKKAASPPGAKFTPEQQFFLGYAQSWCGNYRKEMLRLQVATNPHSPPRFRVVGPISNMSEFAQAFQCKEGSAMVRPAAKRCQVW